MANLTQSKLTTMMRESGRTRYWNSVQEFVEAGKQGDTGYARRLMQGVMPGALKAYEEWKEKAGKGAGRRHTALQVVESLPSEIVVFLAIREMFNRVVREASYSSVCAAIGRVLSAEARCAFYRDADSDFYARCEYRMELMKMNDPARRFRFIHGEFKKHLAEKGAKDFEAADQTALVQAGTVVLELMVASTGLFEITEEVVSVKPRKTRKMVRGSDAMGQWLARYHAHHEFSRPLWMPTVEKVDAWQAGAINCPTGTLDEIHSLPMVKTPSQEIVDKLNAEPMEEFLTAINAVQDTAWRINSKVHEVVKVAWEQDWGVGLASRVELALPVKPSDIDTNEDSKKAWKRAAAKVHTVRNQSRSNVAQGSMILAIADTMTKSDRFFFAHQADFRGRIYPVASTLNPQGSDIAKGLLEFADGHAITDTTQADWLAIHGANCFGIDKVSFEDRIAWVLAHRNEIVACAADPLNNRWWTQADGGDKAWQFLAFCFEWAGWLAQGPGFVTHLPVSVDGSNNGLQILSLLSRDELGARLTNVTPSDLPQDVYGEVAKGTVRAILADLDSEDGNTRSLADVCSRLLQIDRKTTKRQVMVLPYGGTFSSCMEYTREWLTGALAKLPSDPFNGDRDQLNGCVVYLSKHIWSAIGAYVGAARAVMTWLQNAARKVTETGAAIEWHTPSGFLVVQKYLKQERKEIYTSLGVRAVRVYLQNQTNEIDARRQSLGIAPNFVHSLDASAMAKSIVSALRAGVTAFAMVHDSYGTHCTHMDVLAGALRHAFATMFSRDLLAEFKAEIEAKFGVQLDPLPEYGQLDPKSVMASEFFFA